MKKVIYLQEKPLGYCISPARAGEQMGIQYRGISLSSSGRDFIRKVEGVPSKILEMTCKETEPANVKSMIAIVHNDLKTEVYLNETNLSAEVVVSRSVSKGEAVSKSDIYHFEKVVLEGISFPEDSGYIVILNNGWDRILCWDFGPLLDKENYQPINYDVGRFIATGFSASIFYDIFDLNENEWNKVILSGWFPFSYLGYEQQQNLLMHIKLGWDIQDIEREIDTAFCLSSTEWLSKINSNEKINKHYSIIEKAIKHHTNKDYDASIHILYFKIEALLREDFIRANPTKEGRNQDALSRHIPTNITKHTHSFTRLLPEIFGEYLNGFYFKDFDINGDTNFISRNTVGHGVTDLASFTRKASLIGFLILDQIHQYTHMASNFERVAMGIEAKDSEA